MCSLQYGVPARVVGVLLRGYLHHSGRRQYVLVDGRTYHVRIDLIDYYNGYIIAFQEALEAILDFCDRSICKRCEGTRN